MTNIVIDIGLTLLFIGTAAYAIYVKLRANSNTRERFAFYSVGAITTLGTLCVKSISQQESAWASVSNIIRLIDGKEPAVLAPVPWSDHALIVVIARSGWPRSRSPV